MFDLTTLPDSLAEHPAGRLRFAGLDGTLVTRTFAEVHADVTRTMAELRASGVEAGDFVGLVGPNSYEWLVADLALLGLDCVSVVLPFENPAEPVDDSALLDRYDLAALLVGPGVRLAGPGSAATAVLGEPPVALARRVVDPGARKVSADVFTVAFSSGTAGTKKGLLLTKTGVVNTIETSAAAWQVTPDDDLLVVMPFSAFQQRYLCYLAIRLGATATVVAPERMFQRMKELEPTIVLGPPSFFEVFEARLRATGRRDWAALYGSRVRLMLTGSAPVPSRLVTLFHEVGAPLYEVYGSTEVGWIAMNLPGACRVGSAGRPVAGVSVTLAEDGEVVVRSVAPQAAGYVFAGEETAATVFRDDGSVATGDLGRWDGDFLTLVGRKKNVVITRSGVKINPEELEDAVAAACPGVKAVVVATAGASTLACAAFLDGWDDPVRVAEVHTAVGAVNDAHPVTHRITKVVCRPAAELSATSGLLTRNLKVDRDAVVRALFPEDAP